MSTAFLIAFWFIFTAGLLVTLHELGHFWVARRCGIRVQRFSVGFGSPLWSRRGKDGVQYQVAWIPLGGYVQFFDEAEAGDDPAALAQVFARQPLGKRFVTILAGPATNLLICLVLFWCAFMIGLPGARPVVGGVQGIAAQSGLQKGDLILAVDGQATFSWDQAVTPLALAAIDHRPVRLQVRDASDRLQDRTLKLDLLGPDFDQTQPLKAIGIDYWVAPEDALVGQVLPGSAADGLLRPGDRILSLNGQAVARWADIPRIVTASSPGVPIQVRLRREGREQYVQVTPGVGQVAGKPVLQLGIASGQRVERLQLGPWDAARASLALTRKQAVETVQFLARLVTLEASPKNLSGVVGIGQAAKAEADLGPARLIAFMATLSLILCIMNLLPIPVLDGGHLVYYLIELVSGRPVTGRTLYIGQVVGLIILVGLIGLANYNDLARPVL